MKFAASAKSSIATVVEKSDDDDDDEPREGQVKFQTDKRYEMSSFTGGLMIKYEKTFLNLSIPVFVPGWSIPDIRTPLAR